GLFFFVGGMRGDPGEDSGCDRACDRGAMLRRERFADRIDRGELSASHFFISASTSSGAAITNVPSPQRFDFVLSIFAILGKSLLSASFSRQDLFFSFAFVMVFQWEAEFPSRTFLGCRKSSTEIQL